MSTPYAIRFLEKKNKEPFSGIFVHHDADLYLDIKEILEVSNKIMYFPIHILGSERRSGFREDVSQSRNVPLEDMKFASNIEEYSMIFNALFFLKRDVYGKHYSHTEDKFSETENSMSSIRFSSGYKGNVVYLYDIYIPEMENINIKTSLSIKITTGTGEELFNGSLTYLEKIKENFKDKN